MEFLPGRRLPDPVPVVATAVRAARTKVPAVAIEVPAGRILKFGSRPPAAIRGQAGASRALPAPVGRSAPLGSAPYRSADS